MGFEKVCWLYYGTFHKKGYLVIIAWKGVHLSYNALRIVRSYILAVSCLVMMFSYFFLQRIHGQSPSHVDVIMDSLYFWWPLYVQSVMVLFEVPLAASSPRNWCSEARPWFESSFTYGPKWIGFLLCLVPLKTEVEPISEMILTNLDDGKSHSLKLNVIIVNN